MKGFSQFVVLSLSALVTLSSSATGATVSFAQAFGPKAVPFAAAPLATLSQFDPALGTLTKVTLALDANTSAGSIAWDNEATIATDVTLGIGTKLTAVGLAGATAVAIPLQTGTAMGVAADNDGTADFIGTDSFSVVGGSGSDSAMDVLVTGFTPYIGLGTFDVTVSSVVETFLSTTGGFGPIGPKPGMTDGTINVIYEYTPIPEPGTLILLTSGLVPLAFFLWRRRLRA